MTQAETRQKSQHKLPKQISEYFVLLKNYMLPNLCKKSRIILKVIKKWLFLETTETDEKSVFYSHLKLNNQESFSD